MSRIYNGVEPLDRIMAVVLFVSLLGNVVLTIRLRDHTKLLGRCSQELNAARALTGADMEKLSAGDAPTLGPINAPATMVIFSDFQCVYWGHFAETLRQVELKLSSALVPRSKVTPRSGLYITTYTRKMIDRGMRPKTASP